MILLKDSDLREVGAKYNIEPAKLKSVTLVESNGSGFYPEVIKKNGKEINHPYGSELVVRFEGHWFRKFTKTKYDKIYPHLSYEDWKLGNKYNRGINEFGRFLEAFKLDNEAAWLSTSWGMFQVMGFNYKVCGYNSVKAMIIDFYERGEIAQLEAFLNYCEGNAILDDLREGRNEVFARVYNGKGYKANKYDTKITQFTNQYRGRI